MALAISKAINEFQPTHVAYEEMFLSPNDSVATERFLNGCAAFVETICYRVGMKARPISPHDLKRITCGTSVPTPEGRTRRAIKADVTAWIAAFYGRPGIDHNEADALAMIRLMVSEHNAGGTLEAVPRSIMIRRKRARNAAKKARRTSA